MASLLLTKPSVELIELFVDIICKYTQCAFRPAAEGEGCLVPQRPFRATAGKDHQTACGGAGLRGHLRTSAD